MIERPDYCLIALLLTYTEDYEKMTRIDNIFSDPDCRKIYGLMKQAEQYTAQTIARELQTKNLMHSKQFELIYNTHFRRGDFSVYLDYCQAEYARYLVQNYSKKMNTDEHQKLADIQNGLYGVLDKLSACSGGEYSTVQEVMKVIEQQDQQGGIPKVLSHISYIDRYTQIENDYYVIIGARPSTGKTTLILNLIAKDIAHGYRVMFYTLETKNPQIVRRLACIMAGVEELKYKNNEISEKERLHISEAFQKIHNSVLILEDEPAICLESICAKTKKAKREHKIQKIYIDYLSYITYQSKQHKSRYEQVTHISQTLKNLALEIEVPVITAAQLNRECEKRSDARPRPSDIKESGQIEQDANIVILLHVDGMIDANTSNSIRLELLVAKYKDGPTGVHHTIFNRETRRITDAKY